MLPITATDAVVPRPVIRMMTGAIDTSGTLRSSSASGMTPASTVRESVNTTASTIAMAIPTTNPSAASCRVWPSMGASAARWAAAVSSTSAPASSTNRKVQTSAGPFAT